jgi:hypothetical protein
MKYKNWSREKMIKELERRGFGFEIKPNSGDVELQEQLIETES